VAAQATTAIGTVRAAVEMRVVAAMAVHAVKVEW
jgi:hypothetical protein